MKYDFRVQFRFIDGLTSREQRKQSRAHVTAQHYRRKRHDARSSWLEASKKPKYAVEEAASRNDTADKDTRCDQSPSSVAGASALTPVEQMRHCAFEQSTTAIQQLGGGRIDPFATYPVPATYEVHELVDHYCYIIPSLMHRHWSRAIRKPRSAWDLFDLYRQDRLSFLGMLHHTAHHLASMSGYRETLQTVRLKQKALHAINQKLSESKGPYDDGTIVAIGLLANGERLWGSRDTARLHWLALKRMLLQRGGFPALKQNPVMHTKLLWSYIALSWPTASDGKSSYVDGFIESVAGLDEFSGASGSSSFRMSCDEFTQFIAQRRSQFLQHRATAAAQGGVSFSKLLPEKTLSPLMPVETGYSHPDKRRAFEYCRMACLVFLNLVIADYGEESQAVRKYFVALAPLVQDDDNDGAMTAEHLLWTFLSTAILNDHYERCWKLARMVEIVKKAGVPASHQAAAVREKMQSVCFMLGTAELLRRGF